MDFTNTMLCWTPGGAHVALVPWPDVRGLSGAYARSVGACFADCRRADFETRKTLAFITAVQMIVRDGCDPQVVHRTLLNLAEYRDGCPDDMREAQ
jgi:hypothetical protein